MRISNTCLGPLLAICVLAAAPAAADDIDLAGGAARLSGTVRSIGADGVVELDSELAKEPLLLNSESVEKIVFSSEVRTQEPPSTLVELVNGDIIPASIESLDADTLAVVSPEAGRLVIPRGRVKSLQLGIQRRKVIYQGPRELEEWSGGSNLKNWSFSDGALVSRGQATASRKLSLTPQFIMRFTLAWQKGASPSFKIYFADPLLPIGERCNRYFMQFGGAGMEIKREALQGRRWSTIAVLNRSADLFPDQRIEVAILVNRKAARLQLFINGENEGEFADPIPDLPDGFGIRLESNAGENKVQQFSDIEILEYDDSSRRHRSEERGDPESDSLISREEDRWTGRLLEIRKTPEGACFVFKTGFQEKPVEIPEAEVSTVFFSGENATTADDKPLPYVLRLPGEGSLGVSSCEFSGDSATAAHPLLGKLVFRRGGIVSIERNPISAGSGPNP